MNAMQTITLHEFIMKIVTPQTLYNLLLRALDSTLAGYMHSHVIMHLFVGNGSIFSYRENQQNRLLNFWPISEEIFSSNKLKSLYLNIKNIANRLVVED